MILQGNRLKWVLFITSIVLVMGLTTINHTARQCFGHSGSSKRQIWADGICPPRAPLPDPHVQAGHDLFCAQAAYVFPSPKSTPATLVWFLGRGLNSSLYPPQATQWGSALTGCLQHRCIFSFFFGSSVNKKKEVMCIASLDLHLVEKIRHSDFSGVFKST